MTLLSQFDYFTIVIMTPIAAWLKIYSINKQ